MCLKKNNVNINKQPFLIQIEGLRTFNEIFLSKVNDIWYLVVTFIKNEKIYTKYLLLPSYILIDNIKYFSESTNSFSLILSGNFISKFYSNKYSIFKETIQKFLLKASKIYQKRLIIKGLGYRLDYKLLNKEAKLYDQNLLEYKLGYSHSIIVPLSTIPNDLNFRYKIRKKSTLIHIQGINKTSIGNYAAKILRYRTLNTYKEKGISYKFSFKKFKIIKKK